MMCSTLMGPGLDLAIVVLEFKNARRGVVLQRRINFWSAVTCHRFGPVAA
jgi:hypothetical protein